MLSDSILSFNTIHDRLKHSETAGLREGTWVGGSGEHYWWLWERLRTTPPRWVLESDWCVGMQLLWQSALPATAGGQSGLLARMRVARQQLPHNLAYRTVRRRNSLRNLWRTKPAM